MYATETTNDENGGERSVRRRCELENVQVRFVFRHDAFKFGCPPSPASMIYTRGVGLCIETFCRGEFPLKHYYCNNYQAFPPANAIIVGIRDRRSPLGRYPSCVACAIYFDS